MILIRVLLIEPVWNWNLRSDARQKRVPTFNRTSMELKHAYVCRDFRSERSFNRTSMELKHTSAIWQKCSRLLLIEPVWNWNLISHKGVSMDYGAFNRTSMELKLFWLMKWLGLSSPFNRTSMELKRSSAASFCISVILLIEPVWNWNRSMRNWVRIRHQTFNRTSMELKPHVQITPSDSI